MTSDGLRARLRALAMLADLPDEELAWLEAHGSLERYPAGETLARKGENVPGMYVMLAGRLVNLSDQGGPWRKVMEWGPGEITGYLPYSRMSGARGNTVVEETVEALVVPREQAEALPTACPRLTAKLVHVMLDRTREFKSSDLQLEKLASLGKLAAGIAHEINNPTSAALRCARLLRDAFAEAETAAHALPSAGLDAAQRTAFARARSALAASESAPEHEEALVAWLDARGLDDAWAADLAQAGVSAAALDDLATAIHGAGLGAAVRALATAATVLVLARDIEDALARVHEQVRAVKGFTYMDRAQAPEPVDVTRGIRDTAAVLAAKARDKGATVIIDATPDLPALRAVGGELNQVWMNLLDNAMDAVAPGGRVTVTATTTPGFVVVRVTDDGPGIPPDIQGRIFDPFFTTKPMGQGTGLGLDIAQRLVAGHHGAITVRSEPGRTEFTVTLPLER